MNSVDNAKHISSLHEEIKSLALRTDVLYEEMIGLEPSARFMRDLNETIKLYPNVYSEWLIFLQKADIKEPYWKSDYEPK